MVSWDVVPVPDELWGPFYLWRLLVDERHQGHGYGTAALGLVADAVRAGGADVLFTSCGQGEGSPQPFYEGLASFPRARSTRTARCTSPSTSRRGRPDERAQLPRHPHRLVLHARRGEPDRRHGRGRLPPPRPRRPLPQLRGGARGARRRGRGRPGDGVGRLQLLASAQGRRHRAPRPARPVGAGHRRRQHRRRHRRRARRPQHRRPGLRRVAAHGGRPGRARGRRARRRWRRARGRGRDGAGRRGIRHRRQPRRDPRGGAGPGRDRRHRGSGRVRALGPHV